MNAVKAITRSALQVHNVTLNEQCIDGVIAVIKENVVTVRRNWLVVPLRKTSKILNEECGVMYFDVVTSIHIEIINFMAFTLFKMKSVSTLKEFLSKKYDSYCME